MSVVITGATGQLGRLVVESLLQQGVPAREITAAGRDTTKIKDLADRGVHVRGIDYDDPASLDEAFHGAARILLISASEVGKRVRQHGNAIDPGAAGGVDGVAVHEGAEVAEHRLDLDLRVVGDQRPEELLVVLAGLGYLHRGLLRAGATRAGALT